MSVLKQNTSFHDLESLAQSLQLESIDVLETKKVNLESHWYSTYGPAELFFWIAKNQVVKHQLNLFGQVVEWNRYDGLKTGYINEERIGRTYDIKSIIEFDEKPEVEIANMGCDFIRHIEVLNSDTKSQMISNYQSYFSWKRSKITHFFNKLLFRGNK